MERLQNLQKVAKEAKKCSDLSPDCLKSMKLYLEQQREYKATGTRTQKLACAHDIKNTAKNIREEVSYSSLFRSLLTFQQLMNLDSRCQMSSFFVTARTSTEHTNTPDYYVHVIAKAFIETVLGMTVEDFCMKFDAFSLLGIRGKVFQYLSFISLYISIYLGVAKNDNERRILLKKRIRLLINAGLCMYFWSNFLLTILSIFVGKVTNNTAAKMSWKNYEDLVVRAHGVVLEGWPNATFDPSNLGLKELEVILATLLTGKCAWRKLSESEMALCEQEYTEKLVNGDVAVRTRKKRSDAGKKRKRFQDGNSSEGTAGTENEECSATQPQKRRNISSGCVDDNAVV